jgi:hypothetical protein
MIDRAHDLPITKQAEALNISRGGVYYLPRPVPEADLAVMRRLDRLHLELPFANFADGASRFFSRGPRDVRAALLPSGGQVAGPEHDDFRADWRAVVEIDDVLVRQADTAGRDVGANGPGFIGAMDAV